MPLPSKTQISDAVEDSSSFLTPLLNGYEAETGILGPNHYSGGFCIVFPVCKGSHKKALRVWHTEIEKVKERYKNISSEIAKVKKSFLANVEYVSNGLLVGKDKIDIVLMDWLKGQSLKQYISTIIDSTNSEIIKKQKLNKLADNLFVLFKEMHSLNFAHGDLQHDNILIDSSGDIKLIDYDNFYVPSLGKSTKQTTAGYNGYQHPIRKNISNVISSEKDDYFAELIIYLSIKAIAEDNSLWDIAKDDDYALLLTHEDYIDIYHSATYLKIKKLGGEFDFLCLVLESYLQENKLENLRPFDVLLDQLTKEPEINDFYASCGTSCFLGEEITFFWDIKHFTKVFLNGVAIPITTNTKTLKATSSQQYTLEVVNGQKVTKKTLKVNVFEKPIIKFSSSSNKLRKGKNEEIELKWEVKHAHQIKLLCKNKIVKDNVNFQDLYKCNLDEDAVIFTLRVKALDKKTTFEEKIKIDILPEATIKFEVDKEYVFPNIPFTLKWETENAKKVTLNGKDVDLIGGEVFEDGIQKETKYTLSVTDEFGTKEKEIAVKMLPLPRIESLVVPMPNIEKNINMTVNLNIPNITIDLLSCDLQKVGLNVEAKVVEGINAPPKVELKSDLEELNYWNKIKKNIKNLFNRQ